MSRAVNAGIEQGTIDAQYHALLQRKVQQLALEALCGLVPVLQADPRNSAGQLAFQC